MERIRHFPKKMSFSLLSLSVQPFLSPWYYFGSLSVSRVPDPSASGPVLDDLPDSDVLFADISSFTVASPPTCVSNFYNILVSGIWGSCFYA